MDFLNLNDKQKEAVLFDKGPLLVLAGAGSGKTRVLTTKIAYLIEEKNVFEGNIVAITFTNKAANEMKKRIGDLLDRDISGMWIGTFHSICARILRRNIDKIGYNRSFSIYDTTDQKTLIKEIIKDFRYKDSISAKEALGIISNCKNSGLSPEDFLKVNTLYTKQDEYYKIYQEYEKRKFDYSALDFDDIIEKTLELFSKVKEVREYYQKKFEYVFVDEYQDTNRSQYELIKYFAGFHNNVVVVGDSDQSIYSFRGADINNILDFEKDFEDAKVIKLEQNYRSTQNILDIANKLIKNNELRKDKTLWTDHEKGDQVFYKESQSDYEEADFVSKEINTLLHEGYNYKDIAILYRTNAQSRAFEDQFMRSGFNYKVVGGLKFYDRKEIKDIVSYLKVIVNGKDDVALKRIINEPKRGIGQKSIEKVEELSSSIGISMMDVIKDTNLQQSLSKSVRNKLEEFYRPLKDLIENPYSYTIVELIKEILNKSGYLSALENSRSVEERSRIENLNEFVSSADDFQKENPDSSVDDYLEKLSLLSDLDKTEDIDDSLSLMTVHAAKGLEFPVCFIVGMDQYLFPSKRSVEEGNIEEERRLFYVAMTRAEKKLYLTSAKTRRNYGQSINYKRSEFIDEIIDELNIIDFYKTPTYSSRNKYDSQTFMTDRLKRSIANKKKRIEKARSEELKVGDKIKHTKWGEGMVVQINESDDGNELIVSFENKGLKHLNQNYAPIEKV